MKISSKLILVLLVVFLLATNIAVVISYQRHLQDDTQTSKKRIEVPETQLGRFFKDELNLNNEQNIEFRNFRQSYNRSANKVLGEMLEIRNEMLGELNKKTPQRDKLDKLADQLGEKHKQLKGLTFDYYLNMQSVLDDVQQEKMVEIFQAMLTDEGYAETPQRGPGVPGQGNGYGRQGGGHGANFRPDSVQ